MNEGEKKKKSCVIQTVKHGRGFAMVWAGISVKGAISLKRIIGTMDMKVSYFVIIILKLKSAVCQKYIRTFF